MARTIAKDHDEKRAQILQTAARVFATEGFDRASMTLLAQECGVSKANIYHYYDGKDALLYDILKTYLEGLRDRICVAPPPGLDAEGRLRHVIREILSAYQGQDHEHQVQIRGLAALPPAAQEELRGYQRDLVRHVAERVREVAPEAFVADRARLRAVTMSIFGMLNWYFMWNSGAGTAAREAYATLVGDLALRGIEGLAAA